MDHGMSRLFVGGSGGSIWQVNLFLQVQLSNLCIIYVSVTRRTIEHV